MTELHKRINAFATLGLFLKQFSTEDFTKNDALIISNNHYGAFEEAINNAKSYNGWFTKEQIVFACKQWSDVLTHTSLNQWLEKYSITEIKPKKVAIIMAGNIPLVGFHDFLCTLLVGHCAVVKLSSNDQKLLPIVASILIDIEPIFNNKIIFTEDRLENFDAVIATGSNNTARYFEYYFKNKPSIIRKNRNSVAILTGDETQKQLEALGEDIFRYYGLGCRNVSKVFVPKGYDFDKLYKAIYNYHPIIQQEKYANNYDYNKAVYLMSQFKILDNGFLVLKEDDSFSSPIASLFYEYYEDIDSLKNHLDTYNEELQCIVSLGVYEDEIPFGETQQPKLTDYADGVDTIDFLLKI